MAHIRYLHGWELCSRALEELVTGTGLLRERVYAAARHINHIRPEELPADLLAKLEWLKRSFSAKRELEPGQGLIAAKCWHMRNSTGAKIAWDILAFAFEVHAGTFQEESSRPELGISMELPASTRKHPPRRPPARRKVTRPPRVT